MEPIKMKSVQKKGKAVWRIRTIWSLVIVLALAAAGATWYFLAGPGSVTAQAAAATPGYKTATVTRGNLKISAAGTGNLAALRQSDLSFPVRGVVNELDVKIGDTVTVGQVLAKMNNSPALQATLATAQLQALQAQQALDTLMQGGGVALAQSYQTWLSAQDALAKAQTAADQTLLSKCSKDVSLRLATILQQARQRLDQLTAAGNTSQAWVDARYALDTAQANYDFCASGYTAAEKATAQANLAVAKTKLTKSETTYNTLKAASGIDPTQLALAQAKLADAQTQVTKAQSDLQGLILTASFNGMVTFLAAGQGEMVDTTTFITIADRNQALVNVSVDETDAKNFAVGETATVVFDALPNQTFNGTVTQVDPQLVSSGQVQMVQGVVALDQASAQTLQSVPLGLNASVEVIKQQASNVLLVPIEAVRDLGGGQYSVFVVGSNGKLTLKVVQVGLQDSSFAEITSGLTQGQIVTTGTVPTGK